MGSILALWSTDRKARAKRRSGREGGAIILSVNVFNKERTGRKQLHGSQKQK